MEALPLADLHQDISFYYIRGRDEMFRGEYFDIDLKGRHADIPKFKRGKVKLVFGALAPFISTINPLRTKQLEKGYGYATHGQVLSPRGSESTLFEHFKVYYQLAASYPKDIYLVRDQSDLDGMPNDTRTGILLSLEGTDALQDTTDIILTYNLGLRSLHFTWNFDTRYAATCMSKKDYGLTGEGEELLGLMNNYGVIPDLAHASRKTSLDVLEKSNLPALVSHAMAKALYDCARNVDDDVLEKLHENGGVIGIIFGPIMMGGKRDIKEMAKHIIHIHDKFSPDILAIGSDYFGLGRIGPPKGLEDITRLSNLWKVLKDEGLAKKDLEKIAFRNALRVVKANAKRWRRNA